MINWREVPFFRILIPFIFGILASIYWNQPLPLFNYLLFFLSFLLGLFAILKIIFQWRLFIGLFINVFFLLLGYQLTFYHNDLNNTNHFRSYLLEDNLVIGQVENTPQHKLRSIQVDFQIQKIGTAINDLKDCSGKITLWLRNDTINQGINYGDLLILKSAINPVKPNLNPEAFEFKKYLHFKNIHYQSFLPSDQWKKLESNNGNRILNWAFSTRNNLIKTLEKNLKSENEFAVASALILGHKDELSEELKNAYSSTGAMHVLAVSGLHTGLIWGILAFVLGWIRWKHPAWRWIKTGIMILGLWGFALITGASPSVLRAATMFSFLLLGIALNRNTNIYNTLAASAFCLLIFNPYLVAEVGFQLSYFAVVGIVYFYRKIYNLWYIENRIGDYLWSLCAVAISAQLSTFPLTTYYFHQFPVYFLLSGLVVVPFAFLILGLGIAMFLTDWIVPIIGTTLSKILVLVIWLMNAMIFFIEQLPSGFLKNIWLGSGVMILLYLMLFSIVQAINSRQLKYILFGGSMLLLVCFNSSFKTYKATNQKIITFYHLSGKTHIDFIFGNKAISFGDENTKEKEIKFATQNFHLKNKITEKERFSFYDKDTIVGNWFLHNNLIQFFDKRIAFIDELPSNIPNEKLNVNYILIRKDFKGEVNEIEQFYSFEKIILDGALNDLRIIQIKKQCRNLKIPVCDINKEGAFIIDLNKISRK